MNETFDLFAQSPERLDATATLQAAGLGVWQLDSVTNVLTGDDQCCSLFGLPGGRQVAYTRFIAQIHPDDADRVHTVIQQALVAPVGASFDQTCRTISAEASQLRRIRFTGRSYVDDKEQRTRLAGVAFDLTDDKQPTAQKQQEQHERFQLLVEQSPVAMALFSGLQLTLTIANKRMLAYWDRTIEQVRDKPLPEVLPNAAEDALFAPMMSVYTTGEKAMISESAIKRNRIEGTGYLYVDMMLEPFRDADGSIAGVLVVGYEVTDRVAARQAAEDRRLELMAAIDAAEISIWSLDMQTGRFRSNDKMKVLFGLPNEPEADVQLIFDPIVDEDRHRVLSSFAHALQYESGGRCEIQYTITHPSTGQKRIIRSRGQTQFDSNQVAQRFSCIAQDITVRQQAEDALRTSETRFRTLANSIDHLAWIANADGWIYWYNQRWYDYTGTNLKQMEGWGWQAVHHPDHIDRIVAFVEKAWQQGEPFELTFPLRRHDGVYRWFLTRAYPIRDEEGQVQQWIGSNTDIDDQKQVEADLEAQVRSRTAQLQILVQDLQRSNENLRQFAYIASHDLQEPLRKIQQFGDLLKHEYGNPSGQGKTYLDRIQSAASRMSTLIRDLLSYSRIATQQDTTQLVSLQQVVTDVLTDIELLIEETGSQFQIDPLPAVLGDALQLGQLFQNLLSNAIKFRRAGVTPVVTISCALVPVDSLPASISPVRVSDTYYRIDVADNGIGFDEKYLDRIFQVFQRLHNRSEYAGTGIGLAICQKVVTNHGGAITARSQPGQGTTFSIYLPS